MCSGTSDQMKKLKKTAVLLLAVVLAMSAAACGSSAEANTVNSAEDVTGKSIGAVKGTLAAAYGGALGTVHVYETADTMIGELKLGIIDCALHDNATVSKAVFGKGVKVLSELYCDRELSMITARENADLMDDLDSALTFLDDEGILSKIIKSYTKDKGPYYVQDETVDRSRATLTVAVRTDIKPYCYYDDSGELAGIDIDVAKAVSDIIGIELIFEPTDAGKLITQVWYGQADIAMGNLAYNEQDGEKVAFSQPYAKYQQAIVVRKR